MAKKTNVGCLIAVIVGVIILIAVLIHLGVAWYFLQARFAVKDVKDADEAASAIAPVSDPPGPVEVKAASPDGAFRREGAEQLYGYYVAKTTIREGQYQFVDIALGAQGDFAAYTVSGDTAGWAPVMAIVADTARPPASSTESTGNRFPILPTRYSVVGDKITFSGHDDKFGNIAFSGKLDLVKIGKYIELNEGSSEPVMTGDLTINGKVYPKVEFTYNPGD